MVVQLYQETEAYASCGKNNGGTRIQPPRLCPSQPLPPLTRPPGAATYGRAHTGTGRMVKGLGVWRAGRVPHAHAHTRAMEQLEFSILSGLSSLETCDIIDNLHISPRARGNAMPDHLTTCLNHLRRISKHRNPRFDFTFGARETVRKGFTYDKGQGSGRPKQPEGYTDDLTRCLTDAGNLMFLYPGHYDLAVVDVDSSSAKHLLDFIPPLFHSPSRSGKRGGHLWYYRPRYPGDLKPLKPREFSLRGTHHRIDVQYTQFIRVPMPQIAHVLGSIASWLEHPPSPISFPYELLGLSCIKGERDTKWWHYILAQTEQLGDPELVSEERWREVAEETGYFADNSEQGFLETFHQAKSKATITESLDTVYPYDHEGATRIFADLPMRFRYNLRASATEYASGTDDWKSMGVDLSMKAFCDHIRRRYRQRAGRNSTTPWEPHTKWSLFLEWLDTYAITQELYDPLSQHIRDWRRAEPLPIPNPGEEVDEGHSLLLSMFGFPETADTGLLRKRILHIEINLLLTYARRLITGSHTGQPDHVHFPYFPVFVGSTGIGKSLFASSLGMGEYHSSSIRFDDPPKEFGEKAQIVAVVEFKELREQLGRRGNPNRGHAKEYIEKTRFTYRAAYARGAKASMHYLMGILMGSSNLPIDLNEEDGLWRRLIHLPVQKHPDFGPLSTLDFDIGRYQAKWSDMFPRAMSRAIRQHEAGKRPRIDEGRVVVPLHELTYSMDLSQKVWIPRATDGVEFD